jgi:DNA-binding MarR family transcriptional regulator
MQGTVDDKEVERFLTAWFAVRQLIQAANFNHFQKAGLSATQFMTLNLLPENGDGVTIGELARRMNLKPATVAKTVDSLETRKMLARKKSAVDGRLVLVNRTAKGKTLQNAAAGQFRRHIAKLFSAISLSDRAALTRGLESLVLAARVADENLAGQPPLNREKNAAPPAKHSFRRSRLP